MKVKGNYVSVWDDGVVIESVCEYDTETREVEVLETFDPDGYGLDIVHEERVELPNGQVLKDFICNNTIYTNGQPNYED